MPTGLMFRLHPHKETPPATTWLPEHKLSGDAQNGRSVVLCSCMPVGSGLGRGGKRKESRPPPPRGAKNKNERPAGTRPTLCPTNIPRTKWATDQQDCLIHRLPKNSMDKCVDSCASPGRSEIDGLGAHAHSVPKPLRTGVSLHGCGPRLLPSACRSEMNMFAPPGRPRSQNSVLCF